VNSPHQDKAIFFFKKHTISYAAYQSPLFLLFAPRARQMPRQVTKKAGTLRSRPGFSAYASSGTNRLRGGPAAKYQNQQNGNENADYILIHKRSLLVVEMALDKLWTF
jgi:hypothetical protein